MLELQLNLDSPIDATTETIANRPEFCWADITVKIANGDTDAFAVYYERFFDLMFVEAKRITNRDESTCLDIVQDSMLKVIRTIKKIDDEKRLAGWSRAVVKSSAYDWLRQNQRDQKHLAKISAVNSDRNGAIDDKLTHQARLLWIEQQLLNQPAEIQQLFSLRYRLGWTLKKIANSFGVKTGAVDGKLNRAIEKLKSKAELEGIE